MFTCFVLFNAFVLFDYLVFLCAVDLFHCSVCWFVYFCLGCNMTKEMQLFHVHIVVISTTTAILATILFFLLLFCLFVFHFGALLRSNAILWCIKCCGSYNCCKDSLTEGKGKIRRRKFDFWHILVTGWTPYWSLMSAFTLYTM